MTGSVFDPQDELFSTPRAETVAALAACPGDVVVLGAGGKMGPSLTRMLANTVRAGGGGRRIHAVSRWSNERAARSLAAAGVEIVHCDLLDRGAVSRLPDAPNVIFMAGQKFGTSDSPATTWAMNTLVPAHCAERYRGARVVAFSTGNVYPLSPTSGGGARETDPLGPIGEYACSCVGRERIFEYVSGRDQAPLAIIRLNYAIDLRYGVLVDIAQRLRDDQPVPLGMGFVNVIWQGDANRIAIEALPLAASPPFVVNVTGHDALSVHELAARLAARLGVTPRFTGSERPDALLSNTERMQASFASPEVSVDEMLERVAQWIESGARFWANPHISKRAMDSSDDQPRLANQPRPVDATSPRARLRQGQVIPAHPLALTASRQLDERRQRALTRYYLDAGAGGIAVGVHTTQFAIRDSAVGLYRPVLELASETARQTAGSKTPILIAGICGHTAQARAEAEIAIGLGYHAGLLSLGDWRAESEDDLLLHCRVVGEVIPLVGFYLQPAVGGRVLSYRFWRELAELPAVWAVKIAPFNRYQTIDVVRAIVESGRDDIALYTGNDDNIVADLLTPFPVHVGGRTRTRWIDGGLLGQWATWTHSATKLLERLQTDRASGAIRTDDLREGAALTDANAAVFDAAHGFRGCIPGIHEVLRRQGLLAGTWCLDPDEGLSPDQGEEITRVQRAHPELADDAFVREHLDDWMR